MLHVKYYYYTYYENLFIIGEIPSLFVIYTILFFIAFNKCTLRQWFYSSRIFASGLLILKQLQDSYEAEEKKCLNKADTRNTTH